MRPDITLVVPPRLWGVEREVTASMVLPHIGLASICSYLRARGVEYALVDAWAEGLDVEGAARRIFDTKSEIVGFTSNTYQIWDAHEVAGRLKRLGSVATTLLGGYHANALPEQTLRDMRGFDYLAWGEGEVTVWEFLARRKAGRPVEGMAGLSWREGNGEVRLGPARSLLPAEELPVLGYDGFPVGRYTPMYHLPWERKRVELPTYTARGCPYECAFCSNFSREVRFRDMEKVLGEILDNRSRFGVERILFTDENFPIRRDRVEWLCEEMIRHGLAKEVRWCCQSRVDMVDGPLLELMKRAGCMAVAYGVESGNQRILDLAGKKIRLEDVRRAVGLTRAAGLIADAQFILGLPYDTRETIGDTVRFVFDLDPHIATLSILVPFPGSRIMEMAKRGEGGLRLLTDDWRRFGKQIGGALCLECLDRKSLESIQFRAYLRFYRRPSKLLGLLRISSPKGVLAYLAHVAKGWLGIGKRPLPEA